MADKASQYHEFAFQIAKIFRLISNNMLDAFNNFGHKFTSEQVWILVLLWEKEGISQFEIGNTILRDKATVSHLLNSLEEKNLITRTNNPNDQRQKLIKLTEKGRALKEQIKPHVEEVFVDVLSASHNGSLTNTMKDIIKELS